MKVRNKKELNALLYGKNMAIAVGLGYHFLSSNRMNKTRATINRLPTHLLLASSSFKLVFTMVWRSLTVSGAHSPCITTVSPGKRRICMRSRSFVTVRVSRSRRVSVTSTRCVIMTVSRCVVTSLCTLQLDITHALTNKNSA